MNWNPEGGMRCFTTREKGCRDAGGCRGEYDPSLGSNFGKATIEEESFSAATRRVDEEYPTLTLHDFLDNLVKDFSLPVCESSDIRLAE